MLPAVRNTALMRGKTYIGIDFGTSTTVVSIVSYDEYDHKIHTKSLRLPQMLPDGTLYRSEIVPTVIAWLNGCILVGEGASQMKYQLKKGKNIWYSFKMELGEDLGAKYYDSELREVDPFRIKKVPLRNLKLPKKRLIMSCLLEEAAKVHTSRKPCIPILRIRRYWFRWTCKPTFHKEQPFTAYCSMV